MCYGYHFTTAVYLTKSHTGPTPTWQLSNAEAIVAIGLLQHLPQSRLSIPFHRKKILTEISRDCFYMRWSCYVGWNAPGLERERGRRERQGHVAVH